MAKQSIWARCRVTAMGVAAMMMLTAPLDARAGDDSRALGAAQGAHAVNAATLLAAARWSAGGETFAQALDLDAASKPALRARQEALFQELEQTPDDLDLMFEYARVSAQLEDYEAAISTLERMLLFQPDLGRVRLELGALYFKIGSYAAAERYFESVRAVSDPPPAVEARIDAFLTEIEARTATHRFSGEIEAGWIFSTNANFGPDGANVLLAGLDAVLDSGSVQIEDYGTRLGGQLVHEWDLGGATTDAWRTELAGYYVRYRATEQGDLGAAVVRTGPRISLDQDVFGLKARPFAEASYLNVGRSSLYAGYGGGLQLDKTLGDQWFAFGEARALYRDYFSPRNRNDGLTTRVLGGAVYAPVRDVAIRGTLIAEREDAQVDFERSWAGAVRLGATYNYDPGLDFVDRKWTFSAGGEATLRRFDEPDFAVDPDTTRQDIDYSFSVSNDFALTNGLGVRLSADYFLRESSIVNFELDNLTVGAAATFRF